MSNPSRIRWLRRSLENSWGHWKENFVSGAAFHRLVRAAGTLKGIAIDFGAGVQAEGRQVVLEKVLRLVVADDQQNIRRPFMEAVAEDVKRLDDLLLVADVVAQSVVLSQLFQQLGGRFVARYAGEYPISAPGPHLGRGQNDWAVGTS